jgi:hypothetical protein
LWILHFPLWILCYCSSCHGSHFAFILKMKNVVKYHPVMIIPAQLGFIQVCSFPLQTYNIIQVRMQDFTHHDIAEILLKYLNINTTQSINVVVDILVNFVNSSMRKLKTMIMVSKNRIVLWIPALEYFPIFFTLNKKKWYSK